MILTLLVMSGMVFGDGAAKDLLPEAAANAKASYDAKKTGLEKKQTESAAAAEAEYLQKLKELLAAVKANKRQETDEIQKEIDRVAKKAGGKPAKTLPIQAARAYAAYEIRIAKNKTDILDEQKIIHAGLLRQLGDIKQVEIQAGRKEAAAAIQDLIKQLQKNRPGVHNNPAISLARRTLLKSMEEADTRLLREFGPAVIRISNLKKTTAAEKKMLLTVLKEEQKRFETNGWVPWSVVMRPATFDYLKAVQKAQEVFRKSCTAEIDRAAKTKKTDEEIRDLRAEVEAALVIKIVGYWGHQAGRGARGTIALYSNGTIGSPDSLNRWWLLDKSYRLLLRWPKNQANAFWYDNCALAPDGKTYAGANQNRVPINGIYETP